ncbi:MAG: hypothetical protein DHS20C18_12100 [Saprospiraceae bacterium]|nr:MAG: hypothetical protein DHS20C18_12100 [Saprospiraceae bacterium]
MKIQLVLLVFAGLSFPLSGQQILNGSFEGSNLECGIDLSNAEFTNAVPQVVGFGEKNELDIMTASCNFGGAQNGVHFVGLKAKAGITDAIGLELSEPLVPGQNYTVQFHEKIGALNNAPVRLSIGVTNSPTSHGELVFSVFDLGADWTKHEFQFSPPFNATYITVIIETGGEAWVFVDHFSLICPGIYLGKDTTYCEVENVVLQASGSFDSYLWNDQSSGLEINIQEAGLYWVEATIGNCTVRDSIRIFEDALICTCQIYLPNSFSPNDDGINDQWQPLGPCEMAEYSLRVFDRWGGIVFQSDRLEDGWNGQKNGLLVPSGVYIYLLSYRSEVVGGIQQLAGEVYLVR